MKIRVVRPRAEYWYNGHVGETFTVLDRSLDGELPKPYFYYVEHTENTKSRMYFVEKADCEIVTETESFVDLIANLSAEVARLSKRVETLEDRLLTPTIGRNECKPLTRDEIVAKAKADVEALIEMALNPQYVTPATKEFGTLRVEFVVNREKRTVVALTSYKNIGGNFYDECPKGIAKCASGDVFNATIGRAISLRRALGLTVPEEYVNAPAPTEVKVGDILKWPHVNCTYRVLSTEDKYGNIVIIGNGSRACGGNFSNAKIIDDSARYE